MPRDSKGSVIRIALEIDEKKALAQVPGVSKKISSALAAALAITPGGRAPTLLQQVKATTAALEGQARVAEINARATQKLAAADREAARASEAMAKARLAEVRAEQAINRERERGERAQRRNTFGSRFSRGFDSTRINFGAASPLLSSATRAGFAGALGAGLATAGSQAVSVASDGWAQGIDSAKALQQELNVLATQGRVTDRQLDDLRDTARDLGNDLTLPGVSSLDAARAMAALVRPLNDVEAASDGARGALQLAQIAEIDVAEAAKIAAGNVNAFGLEARETTRVADVLSRVIALTGDSLDRIQEGFAQAASSYKVAGFSIEELAQDYIALSQAGVKGSDAGTSLRNAIDRLRSPSDVAAKKMKELGIEVFRADGTMRSHREVIDSVTRAFAKLTPQQQAAANMTIFGTDAQRANNFVLSQGVEKADALGKRFREAAGAAETLEAKSKGLAGAQDAYNSALESFQEKHAAKFLGFVTEAVKSGSNLIDLLDRYIERLSKAQGYQLRNPFTTFNQTVERSKALDSPKARLNLVQAVLGQINSSGKVDPAMGARLDEYLLQRNPRNAKNVLPFANPGGFTQGGALNELRDFLADLSLDLIKEVKKEADAQFVRDNQKRWRDSIPRSKPGAPQPGGNTGTGAPAEIDTSDLEGRAISQRDVLKDLQARFTRLEKELGKAADEATLRFYVGKLRQASAAIQGQEKLIVETERAISIAQDAGRKDPKGRKLIDAAARSGRLDADRDARARASGISDQVQAIRDRLAKSAADRAKRAGEKAAEARKEGAQDSLESQVQRAERTLKTTEDGYSEAVKAIEKALTPEGVEAAVEDATELAMQLRFVGETLAKLKKALADKSAGKETKASIDELAGALGGPGKLGGLNAEMLKRLGEIYGAKSSTDKSNEEALTRSTQAREETIRRGQEVIDAGLAAYNENVLRSLETELGATPVTRANAAKIDTLLGAIAGLKEAIIDAGLERALKEASAFRQELEDRIEAEKDTRIATALQIALDRYDDTTVDFDEEDDQGRPTGRKVTVTGGKAIAEHMAKRAAERAKRDLNNERQRQVEGMRKEIASPRNAALGSAAGQVVGDTFDALINGGKGSAALEASLRQAVVNGVRDELQRGVEKFTQAILSGTAEQKKAAQMQIVAALEMRASASTLLALTGQRGRGAQGRAVLGALAGLYLGDRAGLKGDGLTNALGIGASLATGNVLGAVLGLGKIKGLKLPKFADGGRMVGAGIVGEKRPEIFVPERPGFVLPNAEAALERLGEIVTGGRSSVNGGRSAVYAPTFIHNGDIHDRADADRILEGQRQDLYNLVQVTGA